MANSIIYQLTEKELADLAERLIMGYIASQSDDNRLVTADEAAKMLRVGRTSIYNYMKQGLITNVGRKGKNLFRASEVMNLVKQ